MGRHFVYNNNYTTTIEVKMIFKGFLLLALFAASTSALLGNGVCKEMINNSAHLLGQEKAIAYNNCPVNGCKNMVQKYWKHLVQPMWRDDKFQTHLCDTLATDVEFEPVINDLCSFCKLGMEKLTKKMNEQETINFTVERMLGDEYCGAMDDQEECKQFVNAYVPYAMTNLVLPEIFVPKCQKLGVC